MTQANALCGRGLVIRMKRTGIFLCSVAAAVLMTGCGAMPDLTQEETDLISEYAVGVLLKYDTHNGSRLVDTSAYDEEPVVEEEPEEEIAETVEEQPEIDAADTAEVIDVSQDEVSTVATIEEYYGIQDISFQYEGYEVTKTYPSLENEADVFFAMEASEGTDLLVVKFTASNTSGSDVALNMIERGARFRIAVNDESSRGALTTMLLNDMQTYDDVIPAGSQTELVSIIEVPEGTNIESISLIMRGNEDEATLSLE
jgi:hypothetical protein